MRQNYIFNLIDVFDIAHDFENRKPGKTKL